MNIDSKTIGQNIARVRKLKEIKAATMAVQLKMKEATYTKYERGETAITLEFIQKVAEVLQLNPIWLLTSDINNILNEYQERGTLKNDQAPYQNSAAIQNQKLNELLESVVEMNRTLVYMLKKRFYS